MDGDVTDQTVEGLQVVGGGRKGRGTRAGSILVSDAIITSHTSSPHQSPQKSVIYKEFYLILSRGELVCN